MNVQLIQMRYFMMNYEFKSILSPIILELVSEKQSLGFKYETALWNLKKIDLLAVHTGLQEIKLSKEFVQEFIRKKPNEKAINVTNRIGVIRVLAEYMIRKGYRAYVVPPLPARSYNREFVPYVFTEDEVSKLFHAIDEYANSPSLDGQYYPQRKKYSVIFRILYSTGMRIGEVLNLKVKDIDFGNQTFTIKQAKNNSERVIPVHKNMINIIKKYMAEEEIYLDEKYLFANRYGGKIDQSTVDVFFLKFLHMAGISHPKDGPRVHSFRHTFCVHRLKKWVVEGRDINALFPYLCAYMGHADTRCTEYYLRLTADLYPDIVAKAEKSFEEN